MSFFDELKRRNVFRVGIAYAISAWVVLQVVDLVLDNTETPAWVMTVIMLLALLGFVIALVISWAYELTPEGIKREEDVVRDASITQQTSKKLDVITLAAVGLVIVLFVLDRFVLDAPTPAVSETAPEQGVEPVASESSPEASTESMTELERGVAVLPFENLSEDPANAFFAGGVHEDVLTQLSRIAGLRVISRTSMIRIAERGLDIREIGQQLGVSHVLEGSVRRAGDQVRVTVQLIDASTDQHLWADNFDRKLDDIFAIQSEIAQNIAGQLETELTAEEVGRIAEVPTENLEAYELYMKAREINRVWSFAEGFKQQRDLLEQAVALDPGFLDAQVLLAGAYGRLAWIGADPDGIYREKAKTLTDFIVQTWPDRPEATDASASYAYTIERDYEKALEGFMALLPYKPNSAELLLSISGCHKRLEQYEQGLVFINRAESLDPEHVSIGGEKAFQLVGLGRHDEALEQLRVTTERFPMDISSRRSLASFSMALKGDVDTYLKEWEKVEAMDPELALTVHQLMRIRLDGVDPDSVIADLDKLYTKDDVWSNINIDVQIAELLNLAGREEESKERAKRALSLVEAGLSSGKPLPGNTPKVFYSQFAYWACLSGDTSAFNRYKSIANAMTGLEFFTEARANLNMTMALAECGDVEAAWKSLPVANNYSAAANEWELVLDPLYKHYFSDVPEYQAIVAAKSAQ